jgi:hypothetical protein
MRSIADGKNWQSPRGCEGGKERERERERERVQKTKATAQVRQEEGEEKGRGATRWGNAVCRSGFPRGRIRRDKMLQHCITQAL